MNEQCPQCGSQIKTVPAGVSKKTGNPYNAFQACSNRNCNWKPLTKPANIPPSGKTGVPNQHQEVLNALRELYALQKDTNRGIAEILSKLSPEDEMPEPHFG